ncbi:MAG: DUF3089 domain-containing protein [Ignavibacteriaceae bacterium]|nr:DUF3089 domain-containing protein [Ignavibacteriaceae bacterium]
MNPLKRMFTKISRYLLMLFFFCTVLFINSCSVSDPDPETYPEILTGVTLSDADFQKLKANHRPLKTFEQLPPPSAPDYSIQESWAALWSRADEADVAPPNSIYQEAQDSAEVDVFFLHPTCYTKKDFWNGPIEDEETKNTVSFMMMYLASTFNSTARVYAPRYRQFTLFAILEKETMSGMQAIELAYSDVERAFDYYIKNYNNGRPFILASHSQGSMHAGRLLQTKIVGTSLQSKLVAAYLIGMAIPDNLSGISPASSATDYGVYINWNSLTAGADTRFFTEDIVIWVGNAYRKSKGISILQVNPLSWLKNGGKISASNNPGSLPSDIGTDLLPLVSGVTGTDASGNVLIIDKPTIPGFPGDGADAPLLNADKGDYHNYDYQLFYESIRKNSIDRVKAYLKK